MASNSLSSKLRILTLNVWGLAIFSKVKDIRIPAIATRLVASEYDVIALQEIWCESTDWKELQKRCSTKYPFSKFFYSGSFGSGLAILSRFPIVETHTHPYSLNGQPIMVHHGDWIVAKAAGCATIKVDGLGLVDFWVTHTVAAGGEGGPESKRAHRITQAYEMARFAKNSAKKGHHVVCLGDFNSTPPSLSIAILRDVGELIDAFLQSHPQLPSHAISLPNQRGGVRPDPRQSISELGITCDSPLNTWTAGKPLDERAKRGAGKRLDYIFFRGPVDKNNPDAPQGHKQRGGRLRCIESNVVFTEMIEGHEISFSDHYGLEATLEILEQSIPHTDESSQSAYNSRLSQTLTSSLSALAAALSVSRQVQRLHFVIFVALLVLALSAVGFSSSNKTGGGGLGALWTVIAIICGWTSSTAFYSAIIWGEWEKRALRTFLESMELDLLTQRGTQSSPVISSLSPSTSPRIGRPEGNGKNAVPARFQPQAQRLINVDENLE